MSDAAVPDTAVSFEVFLPPAADPGLDALVHAQTTPGSPDYHRWLTPAQYKARFGTDAATMDAAASELRAAGFSIEATHAHGFRVGGMSHSVEQAFGSHLRMATFADGHRALAAERRMGLTPVLAAHHAVIAAFSPVIHVHQDAVVGEQVSARRPLGVGPYYTENLKEAYAYPSSRVLTGKGATVGVLVPGNYNPPDMQRYFGHQGLKVPNITVVNLFGGLPYSYENSAETHLDIQQVGGIANDAQIVLYNPPDLSDEALMAAWTHIVEQNEVDVVNMSFGGPELGYTAAYNGGQAYTDVIRAEDVLFRQGNSEGITWVASSGDLGAYDIPAVACFDPNAKPGCGGFRLSAEDPASSPHVTGVGGTNLLTSFTLLRPTELDTKYIRENGFYDNLTVDPFFGTPAANPRWGSGGGVSVIFGKPDFQQGVQTGSDRWRTVPDVAGHMGGCIRGSVTPCQPERSSDIVAIGGIDRHLHGTSASSPDTVGLIALKIQHDNSRQGNINGEIYQMARAELAGTGPRVFRMNIPANNGYYQNDHHREAIGYYNLVLGWGPINGAAFVGLPNGPFAGTPRTPSNP